MSCMVIEYWTDVCAKRHLKHNSELHCIGFKSIESMSGIPDSPEDLSAALLFLSFLAFFRLLLAFDFFLFFFSLFLLRSGLDEDEYEEDDDVE